MSKKTLTIITILVIGVAGAAVLAFVYRNIQRDASVVVVDQSTLNDQAVLESLSQPPVNQPNQPAVVPGLEAASAGQTQAIKTGQFGRFDPVHYANGSANIYQTADGPVLKLEGFETSNGPDLFVYLATESQIGSITAARGEQVSLGKLKQIEGDQVYSLPADYGRYNSVVIWCRAFDVNFSVAPLEAV
jgi:hypothetical protein